ncbi:sensor histidine kinase [Spirosoma oryzicola]|uniref:sensor histidine kinase n=1 Tax=Spirosoma oryzicola TaxID=2898794 RepID=UPI001E56DF4B|nr:sensor histidine kinase [Spirosoma oryzicola]UHG92490.1 sensor histidine kinase [Spirosoma oryzicola]
MHQRQYHRYLSDKEEMKNLYQRELLQSQLEIQNQTFQQIGEELHDNIGQLLTVALMRLNVLEDVAGPDAKYSVDQTRDIIRTIITDVRALAKTLDQDTVRRFGLVPSLTVELERIQRSGRLKTHLATAGDTYSLGEQTETVLLRMVQEALNNALKHANAQKLTILADYQNAMFTLSIADDGCGFRQEDITRRTIDESGVGLVNLHRRAGLLGGTCTIVSHPGAGTKVEIKLPRELTV